MNLTLPFAKTLSKIFDNAIESTPYAFRQTSIYFASLWLPIVAILIQLSSGPVGNNDVAGSYIAFQLQTMLPFVENCFTYFIVPYFVFDFINKKKNIKTIPFWDFTSKNVFPLVVNQIKASVLILLYMLLLFVPGFIKVIRFYLVTPATFFSDDPLEALKVSTELSKGFFWGIVCVFGFVMLMPLIVGYAISGGLDILFGSLESNLALADVLTYFAKFYLRCFGMIIMTQTFFTLKDIKQL